MSVSQGFIRNLYCGQPGSNERANVQILAFEPSKINPYEIRVRVSDGLNFIDCTLSGPYQLFEGTIRSSDKGQLSQDIKRLDIVQIEYFSRIKPFNICRLELIIRQMTSVQSSNSLIGKPQEISQFLANHGLSNGSTTPKLPPQTEPKVSHQQNFPQNIYHHQSQVKSQNQEVLGKKIQDSHKDSRKSSSNSHSFLTLQQIESNKEGVFIGRLVRKKSTAKELKDGNGIMTVLYLGFVDIANNLVRISIAGNSAKREDENLIRGQVYTIRGIDSTKMDRKKFIYYLRLKEKQYLIKKITQEPFVSSIAKQWFYFDHEPSLKVINLSDEGNDTEVVDLIGVVVEIQGKITYANKSSESKENRQVVRITLKNSSTSTKVSFWAEQMKTYESYQIKKYDELIMCDLKKKKGMFVDFTMESHIIKLSTDQTLRNAYSHLLPKFDHVLHPENLQELHEYFEIQANKGKMVTVQAFLVAIDASSAIFEICTDCRKSKDRNSKENICSECGCQKSDYRYNSQIQIADMTCSFVCHSFDTTTEKLLGVSANEFKKLEEGNQLSAHIENFLFQEHLLGIQFKNDRFVLRSVENVEAAMTKKTKANIAKIKTFEDAKEYDWLY